MPSSQWENFRKVTLLQFHRNNSEKATWLALKEHSAKSRSSWLTLSPVAPSCPFPTSFNNANAGILLAVSGSGGNRITQKTVLGCVFFSRISLWLAPRAATKMLLRAQARQWCERRVSSQGNTEQQELLCHSHGSLNARWLKPISLSSSIPGWF